MHNYCQLDLNDWLRGERDWRDLLELIDQFRVGSAYLAAIQEDEDLAAELLDGYRPPRRTGEPPGFAGFDAHRYDMARLIATVEQLIAVTAHVDASGIEAAVPVPAVELLYRAKGLRRLRDTVEYATGA